MHSQTNVLVKRLAVMFGEPKTDDPESFLAEYAYACKAPKDILVAAADVLIKQRKYRSWPTVAECLDAIESASKQQVTKGKMLEPIQDFEKWFQARLDRMAAAKTRPEMQAIMDELRPYDAARWVAPYRLSVLGDAMVKRCEELFGHESRLIMKRVTGERDE